MQRKRKRLRSKCPAGETTRSGNQIVILELAAASVNPANGSEQMAGAIPATRIFLNPGHDSGQDVSGFFGGSGRGCDIPARRPHLMTSAVQADAFARRVEWAHENEITCGADQECAVIRPYCLGQRKPQVGHTDYAEIVNGRH